MKTKLGTGMPFFAAQCCTNEYGGNKPDLFQEHWEQAKDIDDFYARVVADPALKMTQGYAEISKLTPKHWYRCREMFGDRCFKTDADAGAVKITSEDGTFSVGVPNGKGDGTVRCAIFDNADDLNAHMLNYTGISLHGSFLIQSYDCETDTDDYTAKLAGDYLVYSYEGLVAFVKFR